MAIVSYVHKVRMLVTNKVLLVTNIVSTISSALGMQCHTMSMVHNSKEID